MSFWATYRQRAADRDIVDEIDALVDEQLNGGEARQGFDFGDPSYPKCPHCERHWHGLPLTQRVAAMYGRGLYDETYRVDEDDSLVICPGSEFIGPMQPPPRRAQVTVQLGEPSGPSWIDEAIYAAVAFCSETLGLMGSASSDLYQHWFGPQPGTVLLWPENQLMSVQMPDGRMYTDYIQSVDLRRRDDSIGAILATLGVADEGVTVQLWRPAPAENRRLPMRLEDV